MIHNSAVVGDKVVLGENVKIGPFCVIDGDVTIGNNVELKSHVVIEGRVTIGEGTIIYSFASLCYPQTLQYDGEDSEIIIGKNNRIREYVTIQHGTKHDKMVTRIGDNCLLMVGTHIAHNCVVGNNAIFANYVSLAGHVEIGDFVTIGGLSAVKQFIKIGNHVMIGGLSGVDKDVIPYGLVSCERAKLEGVNFVGMNRRGFNKNDSMEANRAIKEIFNKNSDVIFNERVTKVKNQYKNNEIVAEITEAILLDKTRNYCGF